MGDWFTESFGEDYMVVYRHRNLENAELEIGSMMKWMDLETNAAVLDIGCGTGRHAHALKSLGYRVTGLDLSEVLLSEARQRDDEGHLVWIKGDMRKLPLENDSFDATVNLFTSFGYFDEFKDNIRVLAEIKRVLKPEGRFLIDFLNPTFLKNTLVSASVRVDELTGLHISEKRSIEGEFVVKRIEVKPQADQTGHTGPSRHYEERVRLISLEQFKAMLEQTGLVLDSVYGGYEGSAYTADSSKRLILLGRRPG
ncbi:class I SAM-dependent methyltransferase [Cohnella sp.]|uniref:class I SAM-dependent methyltransferase n=1 Tax=Cohnella sp. TaxID=1883426 RepID=UPI00356B0402